MAAGSGQARRDLRDAAGYFTGQSSANNAPRCDSCKHMVAANKMFGATKYARFCLLFNTDCKTHGCCQRHERKAVS